MWDDIAWSQKKKQKIFSGLCCPKFCELKETERVLGFWSTVYPLRDQSPCFTFILCSVHLVGKYKIQARHRAASGTRGATRRARTWSQVASPLIGQGWRTRRSVWSSFWAQRATDSLSKAPSSGNTLRISSSLFDCLVPLMRGTKPPTQKSSEAALREGAAYHLQKLAWLRAHSGVIATVQTLSPARHTRALEAGTPLFQQTGKCAKLTIHGDVVVVTNGFHESLGIASSNVTRLHTHSSSVTSMSEFSIILADWKYFDKVIRLGLDLNRWWTRTWHCQGYRRDHQSFNFLFLLLWPSSFRWWFFFLLLLDCLLIECQLFLLACCRTFIFFFFQVWLFFTSLPFVASVSSGLKKSFTSSSHLFLSLPTALHVLILVLNPGFHSAAFLTHRSFGGDATLIANRHFILLCISIEHGILASLFQSLCLSLLQRTRRYLGRNRCQCCFLLVFRFRSSLGFLFFLNVAFLIFMLLAIFFCIFFLFIQWIEASSVLFIVSIFRVRLSNSMFHTRSPM